MIRPRLLEPWRTRLLWTSLGFNLFAAALITAPHLSHRHPPGPPDFDTIIARVARSLPPTDIGAFRAAMDRGRPDFDTGRIHLAEIRLQVARTLASPAFDPAAARIAFQAMRQQLRDGSERFDEHLIDALANVSPQGRAKLAETLSRGRP